MKRNLFTIMLAFLVVFGMNAQKANSLSLKNRNLSEKEKVELMTHHVTYKHLDVVKKSKAFYINEGFEAGIPATWMQYQVGAATDAAGFETDGSNVSAHSGLGQMYHNDYNADGAVDDYIVMPQLSIVTGDALKFWQADYYQTYYEYHGVMISTGSGDPSDGDFVEVYSGDVTETWEETTIDLSSYDGQSIYIAFRYQGDWMDEWYIDDVSVGQADPHDLGVTAISPASVLTGGTVTPQVTIHNYGTSDEATYDVVLTDASGYTSTKNVAVNLAAGADAVIDMDPYSPADGTYTLTATVTVASDADATNNSMDLTFKVLPIGLLLEDFEGGAVPPYGWEVTTGGDYAWTLGDDNTWFGTMDNFFAVMEADVNGVPDTLVSPQLTLDGSVTEFSYDVIGGNNTYGYGNMFIQIMYSADKVTWTNVGTAHDMSADDARHYVSVDISAIPNGDYYFAIEATSTFNLSGYTSWVGIDNIAGPVIAGLSANDLMITDVTYPHDFVMDGAATTITATVKNAGTSAQTGTVITLQMDGGSDMTATIGTLAYGESEVVNFSWTAIAGQHTFSASVAADDNATNDTGSDIGIAVGTGWLYEGFESGTFVPAKWEGDVDGHWFDWTDPFVGTREGTHVAGTATSTAGTYTDAMLATPKVTLTGAASEFLAFYAALGNDGVGANQLDVAYSADKVTWTDIATDLSLTDKMQLFSYDLSAIPAGDYYIGFRAAGAGDGTYSTLIALDHVVAPMLTPPSTEADFLTYSIDGNVGVIDNVAKTVVVQVPYGTDVTALVATFTLSDGATAAIGGTAQVSGTTANDFTNVVAYDLTAEDMTTVVPWGVMVQVAAPTEVANIAALRAGATDGTVYKLMSEAVLTYQQSYRGQKFIQDASAGILIDDNGGVITTTYNLYDGITGIVGTLSDYNGMLQFVPASNSAAASSTGNMITPEVVTATDLSSNFEDYEAELVQVLAADFTVANGTDMFVNNTYYDITDASSKGAFLFKPMYGAFTTTVIPDQCDITGVCWDNDNGTNDNAALVARDPADFANIFAVNDIASKGISVYPNPSNGTFTVNVESNFNLDVLDITGKVINTRVLNGNSTISIENAGVYFLRFSNEEGSVTQKVIVQ